MDAPRRPPDLRDTDLLGSSLDVLLGPEQGLRLCISSKDLHSERWHTVPGWPTSLCIASACHPSLCPPWSSSPWPGAPGHSGEGAWGQEGGDSFPPSQQGGRPPALVTGQAQCSRPRTPAPPLREDIRDISAGLMCSGPLGAAPLLMGEGEATPHTSTILAPK